MIRYCVTILLFSWNCVWFFFSLFVISIYYCWWSHLPRITDFNSFTFYLNFVSSLDNLWHLWRYYKLLYFFVQTNRISTLVAHMLIFTLKNISSGLVRMEKRMKLLKCGHSAHLSSLLLLHVYVCICFRCYVLLVFFFLCFYFLECFGSLLCGTLPFSFTKFEKRA